MTTRLILSALSVAVALAACTTDMGAPDLQRSADIDTLIVGVDPFPEHPTWPERQDSSATDTVASTDTLPGGDTFQNTTWLEEVKSYSASANPEQFMMYDPQASVLWPGNLVQGNSIASGVPNSVPVADRQAANITLAIVSGDSSGTANKFFRTVPNPRFSTVNQAMNEILAGYAGGTPAKYSYSLEQARSATQLQFDLGFGYSGPATSVNGEFGLDQSQEKSTFAVRLTQQYFSMVLDDPEGPAGVFGPTVTAQTLAPYTGPGNPICYISSVTYGRVYLLLYQSTASAQDLSAALNFAYNGGIASGSVDTKLKFSQIMNQTTVKVIQIGGDPAAGLSAATGLNFDAIQSFLAGGANFSPSNVGAPISYTIKYLRDASLVRMNNTMEYTITQRTPISSDTTYSQSTFNVFFDNVYVNDNQDPNGGDGGVRMRVGTTDVVSGTDTRLWTSPVNNSGDGGFWDFGQDAMNTGDTFPLNWTVPQFSVENSGKVKIWVELSGNEYDATRQWTYFRVWYEYDPGTHRWTRTTPLDSPTEKYLQVSDVNLRFTFTVKQDIANQLSPRRAAAGRGQAGG